MRNIAFIIPISLLTSLILWSVNNTKLLPIKSDLQLTTGKIESFVCRKGKIQIINFINRKSLYTYLRKNIECNDKIVGKFATYLTNTTTDYMYELEISGIKIYSYEQSVNENKSRSKSILVFFIVPLIFLIIFWAKPFLTRTIQVVQPDT